MVNTGARWRQIIYASPPHLDLYLFCSNGTPFGKCLSYWPPFPISISYHLPNGDFLQPEGHVVELVAALEHSDRVYHVELEITTSGIEEVVAMMQVPFPVLTHLELNGYVEVPVLPGGFLGHRYLGGSASCPRHLRLAGIPFPESPPLLLSASDLVSLELDCIPPMSLISPKAMVIGLAGLTRLRNLRIQFPVPSPVQTRRLQDPPMLVVLPALTQFSIAGDSEYLEDLLARIDTPKTTAPE